jgi:hypothetical protein
MQRSHAKESHPLWKHEHYSLFWKALMYKIKIMAVLLIVVLLGQYSGAATQTPEARKAAIKEQLKKIPMGKVIEVRLLQNGRSKIRGALLAIASESFEIQRVESGNVSKETIAIADVMSVKKTGMRKLYWALIVTGAAAVVIAVTFSKINVTEGMGHL